MLPTGGTLTIVVRLKKLVRSNQVASFTRNHPATLILSYLKKTFAEFQT